MESSNDYYDDINSVCSFDDKWINDYLVSDNDLEDIEDVDLHADELANQQVDYDISYNNNSSIKVYFLYVDKDPGTLNTINSNVIKCIKNTYINYNKSISKKVLINLIKQYSNHENNNYKLLNILKYQNLLKIKDLEFFLMNTKKYYTDVSFNFLTVYKNLDDIVLDNSVLKIFLHLNSLYFIFIKSVEKQNTYVIPSLKIPYADSKSDRKTRVNIKRSSLSTSSNHNRTKRIVNL